jgi:hypothetical protein
LFDDAKFYARVEFVREDGTGVHHVVGTKSAIQKYADNAAREYRLLNWVKVCYIPRSVSILKDNGEREGE